LNFGANNVTRSVFQNVATDELIREADFLFEDSNIVNVNKKIKALLYQYVSSQCYRVVKIHSWIESKLIESQVHSPKPQDETFFFILGCVSNIESKYIKELDYSVSYSCKLELKIYKTMFNLLYRGISSTLSHRNKTKDLKVQSSTPSKFKIAYFPHKGLTFSNAYLKDHYYSMNKESGLYPSKILHIEFENTYSESYDYLEKLYGLNKNDIHTLLFPDISAKDFVVSFISLVKKNYKFFKLKDIFTQKDKVLLFSYIYFSYYTYTRLLNRHFKDLQYVFVGYDVLFPMHLSLAMESLNIKTIALQERFNLSFFDDYNFCIDTYLTSSDFVLKKFLDHPFTSINNGEVVGSIRSDLVYKFKRDKDNIRLMRQNIGKRKLIIALDFSSEVDCEVNRLLPATNWKANSVFYRDMIELAKQNKNYHIIIRGKNITWLSIPYFDSIVKEIKDISNIEVSEEMDEMYYPYKLVSASDLVIAKYTSIGEECLVNDIPVLFHNYTHNIQSMTGDLFDYSVPSIFVDNYDDLAKKTKEILMYGSFITDEESLNLKRQLNGGRVNGRTKERILYRLESLLFDADIGGI
jgi:hypothetical protein